MSGDRPEVAAPLFFWTDTLGNHWCEETPGGRLIAIKPEVTTCKLAGMTFTIMEPR